MLKSTLVTVDADGTTWDKNDSNVKTNVDADGLEIIDKTGASNEVLLEAKYDTSIGETKVKIQKNHSLQAHRIWREYPYNHQKTWFQPDGP